MNKVVLKFLKGIGAQSEAKLYLEIFQTLPRIKFAVIKISGQTLENDLDIIAEDIAYLNQMGIFPMIVYGAGSTLDKLLKDSKKINGIRVTRKTDIIVIKQVLEELGLKLRDKINEKGGRATIVSNIFKCERLMGYGYTGMVTAIKISIIEKALNDNLTPIISPLGVCGKQYLNINADSAAKELVKTISPKKFILLTETGGILDANQRIIPFLNLSSLENYENITGGMLLKVKETENLLKDNKDCAVVITSAHDLLKEIFTVKGSGTFIKYHEIFSTPDINTLDIRKIKWLLENTFEKKLTSDYFESTIEEIFYQKDYEAVAIIKKVNNIPYLDKFAVTNPLQGTGLGKSLWLEVNKKHLKLIWRANPHNPFNTFYVKNCDGMKKGPNWIVYWKNLSDDELLSSIKAVENLKKTLILGGE